MSNPAMHQYAVNNHRLERFTFANAVDREAGAPNGITDPITAADYVIVVADVGQVGFQEDTRTYWRLEAVGPYDWLQITGDVTADPQYEAENKDAVTILAGQPVAVHSSGIGYVLADATDTTNPAVGLASEDVLAAASGPVILDGPMELADWTDVIGAPALGAHTVYYLDDTPGMLTAIPPTTGGSIVQRIGVAISNNTLEVEVCQPIML